MQNLTKYIAGALALIAVVALFVVTLDVGDDQEVQPETAIVTDDGPDRSIQNEPAEATTAEAPAPETPAPEASAPAPEAPSATAGVQERESAPEPTEEAAATVPDAAEETEAGDAEDTAGDGMELPFGTGADIAYAAEIWAAMRTDNVVGPDSAVADPYEGNAPHGALLEIITSGAVIDGHEGVLIAKKNMSATPLHPRTCLVIRTSISIP